MMKLRCDHKVLPCGQSARLSASRCQLTVLTGMRNAKRAQKPFSHRCAPARQETQNDSTSSASLAAFWKLLTDFTAQEARGLAQPLLNSPEKRRALRDAVLAVSKNPWPPANYDPAAQPRQILLGVLASDVRLAVRALRDYTHALVVPYKVPTSRVPGNSSIATLQGGVYIKYAAGNQLCYATEYNGRDRGVLLSLGQQQLGHLPLGLFDEAMAAPPPKF